MSSTEQLDANGRPTTLYVADAAGDEAPGVALFHAWWGLNDDVKAFADRLADAGFFVVAPDHLSRLDHDRDRGGRAAHPVGGRGRRRRHRPGGHRPPRGPAESAEAGSVPSVSPSVLTGRCGAPRSGMPWAPRSCTTARRAGRSSRRRRSPCRATSPQTTRSRGRRTIAAFEGALRDAGREVTIHHLPGHGALVRRTVARRLPARSGRTGP